MCVIGVPELEEKKFSEEKIFEKRMAENFLNVAKDTNLLIQEVPQTQIG